MSKTNQNAIYQHIRINPVTGQADYFFPMEITAPGDKELARARGLEICRTRLGSRVFEAVMVPCMDFVRDSRGREQYVDTPTEIQRRRYLELIKGEMIAQDAAKQDGRCNIPDGRGGLKRCPVRVAISLMFLVGPNPKRCLSAVRAAGTSRTVRLIQSFSSPLSTTRTMLVRWNLSRFLPPPLIMAEINMIVL